MDTNKTFLIRVVVATLALVLMSVIGVLLSGLFNPMVDNKEIFAVLGPAFQTVVGCFVGILGSQVLGGKDGK